MRKGVNKNISPLSRIKEVYHEEVIVEPAKRLLDALFKIEQKKRLFYQRFASQLPLPDKS